MDHTTPVTPSPLATTSAIPPSTPGDKQKPLPNPPTFTLPKFRLKVNDLSHAGAIRALTSLDLSASISSSTLSVLKLLYHSPSNPNTTAPPTRSVTFILRDMPGVAYTTGSDLDNDHKEIHCSLGYIANISQDRIADEIAGVVAHELVHCFQHNGLGSCPGGLIEGVADWVRLKCGYAPPHWKRETEDKTWDAGYQTTGYFLEYLEERFGEGTVSKLNEKLRVGCYEKEFWYELLGHDVEKLWGDYGKSLKK